MLTTPAIAQTGQHITYIDDRTDTIIALLTFNICSSVDSVRVCVSDDCEDMGARYWGQDQCTRSGSSGCTELLDIYLYERSIART